MSKEVKSLPELNKDVSKTKSDITQVQNNLDTHTSKFPSETEQGHPKMWVVGTTLNISLA